MATGVIAWPPLAAVPSSPPGTATRPHSRRAARREPPAGSRLLKLDNVILTPHSTGMDVTAEHAMANRCIDSILAVARNENPGDEYVLKPDALRIKRQ